MQTLSALAALFLFPQALAQAPVSVTDTSTLKVQISEARSQNGSILISVYDNKKAYPDNADNAVVKLKLSVPEASDFQIPNLAPGEYAIVIAHDENDNGKLDTNIVGMPKEGFGFSQNVMGTFGAPSFKKAKVAVTAPETSTQIKMKYF